MQATKPNWTREIEKMSYIELETRIIHAMQQEYWRQQDMKGETRSPSLLNLTNKILCPGYLPSFNQFFDETKQANTSVPALPVIPEEEKKSDACMEDILPTPNYQILNPPAKRKRLSQNIEDDRDEYKDDKTNTSSNNVNYTVSTVQDKSVLDVDMKDAE